MTPGKLTFVIRTLKDRQSQVFEVRTNSRVVKDVVVTKIRLKKKPEFFRFFLFRLPERRRERRKECCILITV
jgi:hypothetical protein